MAVKIVAAQQGAAVLGLAGMRSKRHWVWYSLLALVLLAAGVGAVWSRLLLYSIAPLPDDPVNRAIRILAYHRISCPDAHRLEGRGYGEGAIALQCQDTDRTRYVVAAQLTCSETPGCRWFELLCWDVEKINFSAVQRSQQPPAPPAPAIPGG